MWQCDTGDILRSNFLVGKYTLLWTKHFVEQVSLVLAKSILLKADTPCKLVLHNVQHMHGAQA